MLRGVVVQGLIWESHEALLWPACSSCKGVYHKTRDVLGEERSGEGQNCMTSDMKGQGV